MCRFSEAAGTLTYCVFLSFPSFFVSFFLAYFIRSVFERAVGISSEGAEPILAGCVRQNRLQGIAE